MTTTAQGHPAEVPVAYWWGDVDMPDGRRFGMWSSKWERDEGMCAVWDARERPQTDWGDFMPPEGVLRLGAGKVTVVSGDGDPLWWTVIGFNFVRPMTYADGSVHEVGEYGALLVRGEYDYAEATRIGFAALPWLPAYIGDPHLWDGEWVNTCPCCVPGGMDAIAAMFDNSEESK